MKLNKATALKGALFMILAANVSWEKIEFSTTELAATGSPKSEVTAASGGTSASTGDGKVSTAPAALAVKADGPAPAPVTAAAPTTTAVPVATVAAAKPAALPAALKPSPPAPHTGEFKLCGVAYTVNFEEVEEGQEKMTKITAAPAGSSDNLGKVTTMIRATLAQTIWEKDAAQRILTTHVREARAKQKLSCPTETVAGGSTTDARPESAKDETKTEAEDEQKAKASAVKNCVKDAAGESLDKAERITCWANALEDPAARIEKRDSKGKLLSETALSQAIFKDIEKSHSELKKLLKGELLSSDEDRVEHARSAIEKSMEAIQDHADAYEFANSKSGRSNKTVSKMIDQLAALRKGSEVKEEASKYSERAKEVQEQARFARTQMEADRQELLRNPLDQQLGLQYAESRRDFALVMSDYEGLRRDIGLNFEPLQLTPFKQYQTRGAIDRSDFNEFTKGFAEIQRLMKDTVGGLSNSRGNTNSRTSRTFSGPITGSVFEDRRLDIPTNLGELRSGGAPSFRSGVTTTMPVINLPAIPTSTSPTGMTAPSRRRF